MFQRRIPTSFLRKLREGIWPKAGWKRAGLYLWHRLQRLPGSRSAIAAGFACGVCVSMTPMMGLHFIMAALLAWVLRANILASAIGTVAGNPWTFPFIWMSSHYLGHWILEDAPEGAELRVNFRAVFESLWYGVRHLDMPYLIAHVWPVWWPMMVGSIPLAIIAYFATYWPLRRAMEGYHRVRGLRRLEKLAARAKAMPHHSAEDEQNSQEKQP